MKKKMSAITQPHGKSVPAWKNPWFLFVFGLPAIVVVACFITLYLAIKSDDGVVTKDYYKEGLAINQDLRLEKKAQELGLRGRLTFEGTAVLLTLEGNEMGNAAINGQPLPLFLQNMGVPARDQAVTLVPIAGTNSWRGQLTSKADKGRWEIRLESAGWRLTKDLDGLLGKVIELN